MIVTAIVMWITVLFNGITRSDEHIDGRWAQVEAVLQRRLDLIPQLVATVQNYATHEQETLLGVAQARARALGTLEGTAGAAPKSRKALESLEQAQQHVTSALTQLLAIAEHYPDLKANASFLTLQSQLEGTENRITVERQRYNDAVLAYNARLRIFPSNVIANMFGFELREYFESKVGAEEPVVVPTR